MFLVTLFALALATMLNTLRFDEVLEELVEQRLEVVAQEVAGDVLVGLDLGLAIESMDNLQAVLDRLRAQVAGVRVIAVHDCDGRPIVASAARGDAAAVSRLGAASATRDGRWRRFDPAGIALGLRLTNSYGECAGGVALQYEADSFFATRSEVTVRLIGFAAAALLLVVPAAWLARRMFRRRERLLRSVRDDLDGLAGGGTPAGALPPARSFASAGLAELDHAYRAARPELCEAMRVEGAVAQLPPPPQPRSTVTPAAAPAARQGAGWPDGFGGPVIKVLALTAAALLLGLLAVSAMTAFTYRQTLLPELAHKASAQGVQAQRLVQRALDFAVPLPALVGVEAVFASLRQGDEDLVFLAITDAAGNIVHAAVNAEGELSQDALPQVLMAANDTEVKSAAASVALLNAGQHRAAGYLVTGEPLQGRDGATLGWVYLGHDEYALMRPLEDSIADLAVVLLVSLFLAFEVMLVVVTLNLTAPVRNSVRVLRDVIDRRFRFIHARRVGDELGAIARRLDETVRRGAAQLGITPVPVQDAQLIGVRLLAFLFVFAEELARPIMPVFFGELAGQTEGLGASLGAGVVMTLHMTVVAVSMPLASLVYAHVGRRRMYAVGALLASLGLLGTGLATTFWQLLACRMLSGMGYAATFVACQGFVIETTGKDNRTRGVALMVGGIMLADICGPAIGGVLATWVGQSTTFFLGASVAALAAVLMNRLMGRISVHGEAPPRLSVAAMRATVANRRFLALLMFAAVPAKLLLGGLLYFLVPLALGDFGADAAQTGRVIMLYGLAGLLGGPLFAYLTDRYQWQERALWVGGLLTVAGMLPLLGGVSHASVALAVLGLGLGQALSIPALVTAALSVSQAAVQRHGQGPVMAVLRLIERLGGAAGPLLAALLAETWGAGRAMAWMGAYALVCAVLLWWSLRRDGSPA